MMEKKKLLLMQMFIDETFLFWIFYNTHRDSSSEIKTEKEKLRRAEKPEAKNCTHNFVILMHKIYFFKQTCIIFLACCCRIFFCSPFLLLFIVPLNKVIEFSVLSVDIAKYTYIKETQNVMAMMVNGLNFLATHFPQKQLLPSEVSFHYNINFILAYFGDSLVSSFRISLHSAAAAHIPNLWPSKFSILYWSIKFICL